MEDVVSLKEDARTRKVELITHIEPANLAVLADEAELRQVFVNLVQNAMTALPGGGRSPSRQRTRAGAGCASALPTPGRASRQTTFRAFFCRFSAAGSMAAVAWVWAWPCAKPPLNGSGEPLEAGNQPNSGAVLTLTLRHARCDI